MWTMKYKSDVFNQRSMPTPQTKELYEPINPHYTLKCMYVCVHMRVRACVPSNIEYWPNTLNTLYNNDNNNKSFIVFPF